MDRQTLRDRVHRYNAEGLAGLVNRRSPGRPPRLSAAQMEELDALVEAGPDPAEDGVVRWRRIDLKELIAARYDVAYHVRSVGKLPHRLGFRHMSARPRHPQADAEAREAFKKNHAALVTAALPAHAKDKPIEIWFQDGEAPKAMNRIGQKGGPTRLWARRGARPQAPRDRRYEWAYLFGAVRPDKAKGAALVLPFANADAMNRHLEEIAAMVAPGAHAAVIVDGAGYRQTAALAIPDNITTVTLPSYSPELNPVENVCQYRRQNFLANRVFDDYEAILDACCDAWNASIDRPDKIRSITQRSWAVIH